MKFDAKKIQSMSLLLIPTKIFMIVGNFDSADRKHVRRSDFTIKNQDWFYFESSKGGVDKIYSLCAGNVAIFVRLK